MPTPPITATLNATTTLALRFDTRAEYRLSSIGRAVDDLGEMQHKARRFAFLCDWLWACALDCPYPAPAELAAAVDRAHIAGLLKGLLDAIDAGIGRDGADAAQKKSTAPAGPLIASPSA